MKKILASALSALMLVGTFSGCNFLGGGNGETSSSSSKPAVPTVAAEVNPIVYDVEAIKDIKDTETGTVEGWMGQKTTYGTLPESVIKSPYHTLKINDVEVPVYTARSKRGTHSFAWVDTAKTRKAWHMDVELTTKDAYGKCVVLPESTGVEVEVDRRVYTCRLTELDTYTFTFAKDANAAVTDPTAAPLTLMVTEEKPFKLPDEYEEVVIEPGKHSDLVLQDEYKAYVVKAGYHELTGISLPSNSLLYIEPGAYLKALNASLGLAVIGSTGTYNVDVISRGLIDCGDMTYEGNKHPFWFNRTEDLNVEGMTIINANTWTMCFCDCTDLTIERNLLIGYRGTSDGIMMSDCVNGKASYNFVRTGDDGIEFKATGWGSGTNIGSNCIYEYNDCWTERVSAYGLIWENARDMTGVQFKNNSVGFAYADENGYLCPLEIRLGANSRATWSDVVYENIELYYVDCATVITVKVNSTDGGGLGGGGAILDNISYKNITVKAAREGCVALKMYFGEGAGGDITNITVENMNFCGKVLKASDKNDTKYFVNEAGAKFDELTVK